MTSNFDQHQANEALQRILHGTDTEGRGLATLVEQFQNGFDLANLKLLLDHEDENIVTHGIYILSELGPNGTPLAAEALALLDHRNWSVRYYAIDCLLGMKGVTGVAIAKVLELLADEDVRVRQKAIDFVARKDIAALESANSALTCCKNKAFHLSGLRLVVKAGIGSLQEIEEGLQSDEKILRSYSLAAAIRLLRAGAKLIVRASKSSDTAIREEAELKRKSYSI